VVNELWAAEARWPASLLQGCQESAKLGNKPCSLGFSYRASFICVTIRITNRCDFLYYVFISFSSSFPHMFRALMGPSSGVFQAVVFMLPFGSCSALLIVCVRQRIVKPCSSNLNLISSVISLLLIFWCIKYGFIYVGDEVSDNIYEWFLVLDKAGNYCYRRRCLPTCRFEDWIQNGGQRSETKDY